MFIVKLIITAIGIFAAVAVTSALSVILALLFGPEDDYERDLADREQIEYLEDWRRHHE